MWQNAEREKWSPKDKYANENRIANSKPTPKFLYPDLIAGHSHVSEAEL